MASRAHHFFNRREKDSVEIAAVVTCWLMVFVVDVIETLRDAAFCRKIVPCAFPAPVRRQSHPAVGRKREG